MRRVRINGVWFKLSPKGRVSTKTVGRQNRSGGENHAVALALLKNKRTLQDYCREKRGKVIWYRNELGQLLGGLYLSGLFFMIKVDEAVNSVGVTTVIGGLECVAKEGEYDTLRSNIVYAIHSMKDCVENAKRIRKDL